MVAGDVQPALEGPSLRRVRPHVREQFAEHRVDVAPVRHLAHRQRCAAAGDHGAEHPPDRKRISGVKGSPDDPTDVVFTQNGGIEVVGKRHRSGRLGQT